MTRGTIIILGLVMAAVALTYSSEALSKDADGKQAGKMNQSTALEKVKQWANPDATVSTFETVSVPGISLFSFTPSPSDSVFMHDFTPPRWGVLIRHEDGAILTGKDGLKAALDAGANDPGEIARLALLFLHDHGEFAHDAESPFFQRDSLIYYWRRNDMNRQLMKATLDRDALTVVIEPVIEAD